MYYIYKIVSFIINAISFLFMGKEKYDVLLLQKFGLEKSLNYKILEEELSSFNFIYVNTKGNNLKSLVRDLFYISRSRIVILDSYSLGLSNVKRFNKKKVFQIWHALGAIKKFGYQSLDKDNGRNSNMAKALKMHKNYSCIVSPGTITTLVYKEAFESENVKEMILPSVKYLKNYKETSKGQDQKQQKENKKVLYLPTYRNNSMEFVGKLGKMVEEKGFKFVYKPHPNEYESAREAGYEFTNTSSESLIKECNILITDYSAACFEASLLGKQIIFFMWDLDEYKKERGVNVDLTTLPYLCYNLNQVKDALGDKPISLSDEYFNAKEDFTKHIKNNLEEILKV